VIWSLARQKSTATEMPLLRLESDRLILRPPQQGDWEDWAKVRAANRQYLEPWEPLWPPDCLSRDFYRRRLLRQTRDWRDGRCYGFLIFRPGTADELIGGVNINNITRGAAQFASLGYWLAEKYQGRGYMHEALSLVIDYGFDQLALHRFNASCLPENNRSIALLQRLGFSEEGFARKYINIAGAWHDHILFGLNRDEWSGAPATA